MVKTARKKARPDSIRALNLPELVDVEEDEHRRPVSLTFRSRRLKVVSIEDTWEVVDEWWRPNSVARRYYKVVLKDGSGLTIFRNLLRDQWYEQQA